MIVTHLDDVIDTDRDVKAETWRSRRLLLAEDGMGFSFHDTLVVAGTSTKMQYNNHLEACYILEGEGMITDHAGGQEHPLKPGTLYALNKHDQHTVTALTALRMICIFNPAVTGTEIHDDDGSFPPPD